MSSLNNRTVKLARLHASTHVGGLGSLTETLDSNSKGSLKMSICDAGVWVKATGVGDALGRPIEFIVPFAACKSIELAPE